MPEVDRDGLRIHYERCGTGPAVVLVQGVGVIGDGWRPQTEHLSRLFTVVTIDNRGIGRSTFDQRPLTIEDMAADVLAVADAESIDAFHLAGHSMSFQMPGTRSRFNALTRSTRCCTSISRAPAVVLLYCPPSRLLWLPDDASIRDRASAAVSGV